MYKPRGKVVHNMISTNNSTRGVYTKGGTHSKVPGGETYTPCITSVVGTEGYD